MSQRTVEVDGKEYRYSIGKSHVKVHGLPAVLKEQVGRMINLQVQDDCGCGGDCCYNPDAPVVQKLAVTPGDVKAYIMENVR